MKKALFTVAILASVIYFDQVGINTLTSKAALDVVAAPSDITKTDGLIAPRITGNELKAKDALYTTLPISIQSLKKSCHHSKIKISKNEF
ncbi:hypothetical protein [Chryseobacterium lathyri]|uniref:hypothetical protein n=1 Tax=Chryseobacterium lathyri TaxID=395933 RepID=UPI001CC16010|nr:hypothetical protein [Chryseobacterium lathyri]